MNRKQRRSAKKAGRGAGASVSSSLFIENDVQKLLAAAIKQLAAGQPSETVALCDRALHRQSDLAPALNLKGSALRRMGRYDEGIESLRHAVRLKRDVAEYHYDLGIAYINKGDIESAIAAYREAIKLRRDYAKAYCNLGLALKMQGSIDESVAASRTAIAHDPSLPEAYNNLAFALIEQGKPDEVAEAAEACRKAISLRPGLFEAHNNLGNALKIQGKLDQAVANFAKSVELSPAYGDAHYNLAYTYEQWNRLADAEAAAAAGLRVAPDHPGINLVAAICERRAGKPKKALDRLSHISFADADSMVRRAAHFELGQIHDRLGDSGAAIADFGIAKRLQSESWGARVADKGVWHREIDVLADRFSPAWVQSWTPAVPPDSEARPIFLFGFPRSGTTLLDQILDSHPRLQVVDEQPTVSTLLDEVTALPGGYPDALATLDERTIQRLRAAYFKQVDKRIERQPGLSFIDKMPLNTVRAGPISRIFPDSRFILAIRHPCDVCLSCFMQNFEINSAMANFFTIEESAAFYARVMGLWRQYTNVLSLEAHMIRYEDLVENLETEMRKVVDFVGVDWDDAVLDYVENAQARKRINTPSYSQVTEPIYTRAKYRWHRYRDALAPAMETLAPFIECFGYADG